MPYPKNAARFLLCLICIALGLAASAAWAQEEAGKQKDSEEQAAKAKSQGQPPARVVTALTKSGKMRPQLEYVGTVYFPEVSEVAAEVGGVVEKYNFEEGRRVKAGQELIELNTELVKKDLETARFEYKNVFSSLENARRELERMQALYKKKTVAEQDFDNAFYLVAGLENRATALQAKAARLEIQLERSSTKAPFDGVVLERMVDRGEWVDPGSRLALLARNDVVDIMVHVPEEVLPHVHEDMPLEVHVGGRALQGKVEAVIPQGDVATRTFPVKIRAANDGTLAQGMEARVRVPAGEEAEAVLAPRDAVLQTGGTTSVWVVFGDRAVNIPVQVTAYQGLEAALRSLDQDTPLAPGMQVVVKGNERLRPGQNVVVVGGEQGAGAASGANSAPGQDKETQASGT